MSAFKRTARQEEANELLAGQAQHVCLLGGGRSGKTFEIIRGICTRAIKAPKSRHLVTRFRFNHCKQSIVMDTFPKVMSLAFPHLARGTHWDVNKTDWFATLPGESEIWFGGLDDKERTEKILGNEYATIFLNECSQISWSARNTVVTRLAQSVQQEVGGRRAQLKPRMWYDENPTDKAHWSYRLFVQKVDPETKQPVARPDNYAWMRMNPSDNLENLPPDYLDTLGDLSARMQARFMRGEFVENDPNALFPDANLDKWRVTDGVLPDMVRIVVAVDPSGSDDEDNAENDEIGIVVAGLGTDGNGYVLEDVTVKAGPATWGKVATSAYERHRADKIIGEQNFGGAMVKHVIRTANPRVNFKLVVASRGKVVRAEPVGALCETGKVRFVGWLAKLEDELSGFTTHGYTGTGSPNRADAFVWAISELFPALTKPEPAKVKATVQQPARPSWYV
jgi:predicted phage terminase large subunit-like protein